MIRCQRLMTEREATGGERLGGRGTHGRPTPDGSPPILLHPAQWDDFEADGVDMRWFALYPPLPEAVPS